MGVSYLKIQREIAKRDKSLRLVAIDASGMIFQGPVSLEARNELLEFFTEWYKRQMAKRGGI